VELALAGLPLAAREARLVHYRIDEANSNPYGAWKRMGSPLAPNADQYNELRTASQLARIDAPATVRVENGQATLRFALPRQAVSLVQLDW
jgi:xylan 1,4-beta-xylosidase